MNLASKNAKKITAISSKVQKNEVMRRYFLNAIHAKKSPRISDLNGLDEPNEVKLTEKDESQVKYEGYMNQKEPVKELVEDVDYDTD